MRFYTSELRFYCGVDLHARTMYLCRGGPARRIKRLGFGTGAYSGGLASTDPAAAIRDL